MKRLLAAALAALTLAACQPASQAPVEVLPNSPDPRGEARPSFSEETCDRLERLAHIVAEGRRDGISRTEALRQLPDSEMSSLFRTIVNGVYDMPTPRDAIGWEELRSDVGLATERACRNRITGGGTRAR